MNWKETVLKIFEQRGYRTTGPRRAILEQIDSYDRPFTAEELYDTMRSLQRGIGRATVYRTLELLAEQRCLSRLHPGDGIHAYIVSHPHIHRMVCTNCGTSLTFEGCDIDGLLNELARRNGFQVEGHWLEAFGRCSRCGSGNEASEPH